MECHRLCCFPALLTGLMMLLLPVCSLAEQRQQLTISSTADSGPGSLRAAILSANQTPGPALIHVEQNSKTFNEPQTILLTADLPPITDDLEINGYIEKQLWQATGITVNGANRYRLFRTTPGTSLTLRYFTLKSGHNEQGGAIQGLGPTLIDSMLLIGNSATQGGAIAQHGGTLTVLNSTLLNNHASQQGGALFLAQSQARLTHVTITGNQSPQGAGLYNQGALLITNSIIANNLIGLDCLSAAPVDSQSSHNLIRTHRHCGTPLSSQDPLLGELNYYNGPTQSLPLGGRSPAINVGDNTSAVDENGSPLIWDQRGNGDPRDAAGIVDIGAFEQQAVTRLVVDTNTDNDLRWCTSVPQDCSLRGAIMLANASKRHNQIRFAPSLFTGQTAQLEYPTALPPVTQILELSSNDGKQVVIDLKKEKQAFLGNKLIKLRNVIIK